MNRTKKSNYITDEGPIAVTLAEADFSVHQTDRVGAGLWPHFVVCQRTPKPRSPPLMSVPSVLCLRLLPDWLARLGAARPMSTRLVFAGEGNEISARPRHNCPDVELPSLSFGDVDAGLDESEWMERPAELGGGEVESEGIRPSFMRFFCFIRLF